MLQKLSLQRKTVESLNLKMVTVTRLDLRTQDGYRNSAGNGTGAHLETLQAISARISGPAVEASDNRVEPSFGRAEGDFNDVDLIAKRVIEFQFTGLSSLEGYQVDACGIHVAVVQLHSKFENRAQVFKNSRQLVFF